MLVPEMEKVYPMSEKVYFSEPRIAFAAYWINLQNLLHQQYVLFILLFKGILNFIAIILEKNFYVNAPF